MIIACLIAGATAAVPEINTEPVNVTVSLGDTATFKCKGSGQPTPNIMIVKEDSVTDIELLNTGDRKTKYSKVSVFRTLTDVTMSDEGWYICVVSNSNGEATSRAYLRIQDLCENVKCPKRKYCYANSTKGVGECKCKECDDTRYKPVCGTDCQTYYNKCSMMTQSCQQNLFLRTEHKGVCHTEEVQLSVPQQPVELFEQDTLTLRCDVEGSPEPTMVKWVKVLASGKEKTVSTKRKHIVQSASSRNSGTYRCVARQCGKKIKSANVEVMVHSNAVDDPAIELKSCKVFGDPHIVTFDGMTYDYMGRCTYILAMDCVQYSWMLFGQFMPCGDGITCLESMQLYYGAMRPLQLTRGWIVGQDGEKRRLRKNKPTTIDELTLRYTGFTIEISLPNGIEMIYDGFWGVQIITPPEHVTCGLCGNNNGNSTDDTAEGRYGATGNDVMKFADSWSLNGGVDWCGVEETHGDVTCENLSEVQDTCTAIIESEPFAECMQAVGAQYYRDSCVVDVCSAQVERFEGPIECVYANTIAQHCRAAGFSIPTDFLQQVGCGSDIEIQEAIYNAGCPLDGNPPYLD